jgi:hypothetical protein
MRPGRANQPKLVARKVGQKDKIGKRLRHNDWRISPRLKQAIGDEKTVIVERAGGS